MRRFFSLRRAVAAGLGLGLGCLIFQAGAEVLSSPAPAGEPLSARYRVTVDGTEVPVYLAHVSCRTPEARVHFDQMLLQPADVGETGFASFDLRGKAEVTVTCSEPITRLKLLPSSRGIVPVVAGNRATFTVAGPGQFSFEANGVAVNTLQIFVNPWQEAVPKADDPNVIYFGPGIHQIDGLEVPSGKTVYLADGAILYGKPPDEAHKGAVVALKGDHIVLRGRGIIDGSLCPLHTRSLFFVTGNDISVEGVILRDSSTWTMPVRRSQGVRIDNIKIFGVRANSDGIDVCNSQEVAVTNCYLRTYDDLIVVKADEGQGVVRGVTAAHCVLWNEIAHALSIGAEIRESVEGVRFSDCDIIHDKGREWLLRVYHCDSGPIRDVTFDGIRIEEARGLMSVWIGKAIWSKEAERGHVGGVVFRDIQSVAPTVVADLVGFDADHAVHGVRFEKVVLDGRPMRADEVRQNEFVSGVEVVP